MGMLQLLLASAADSYQIDCNQDTSLQSLYRGLWVHQFCLSHHFRVKRCFFGGRSPCGRQSKITSSNTAIKMTRRLADWVAENGRYLVKKSVPAHIPHTAKLPRIAPLLLPLPPRISITQMMNVP